MKTGTTRLESDTEQLSVWQVNECQCSLWSMSILRDLNLTGVTLLLTHFLQQAGPYREATQQLDLTTHFFKAWTKCGWFPSAPEFWPTAWQNSWCLQELLVHLSCHRCLFGAVTNRGLMSVFATAQHVPVKLQPPSKSLLHLIESHLVSSWQHCVVTHHCLITKIFPCRLAARQSLRINCN